MLAPNMTLELGVREPIQNSSNSQRVEQKGSGPSSFERALERARTEKSQAPKAEESAKSPEQAPKEVREASQDEAAAAVEADEGAVCQDKELAQGGTETKALKPAVPADEDVLVSAASADVEQADALETEVLAGKPSAEILLDKEGLSQDAERSVPPAVGVEVLAQADPLVERLEQEAQARLDDLEKKSKKSSIKDADYSLAQILQGGHNEASATADLSLARGAVAEMQGELKEIRLETGTSLDQKIQVQDLRTAAENGVTEASLKDGNFVTTVTHGDGTADITMQLAGGGEAGGKTGSIASGGKEANFGAMLANQLQGNAAEFVRTGSIVLRDGNMGTINLVLYPESLGNVKISLELNDRMVSAQIRVASEEAFMAFKESISSLRQAFSDSGFDTGSFDLSWSGNGQNQQGGQQQRNQSSVSFAETLYSEMLAEDGLDSAADGEILQKIYSDSSQIAVNIMA